MTIPSQRATIVDVANFAGVSIKTVSRVVNREPHVRPATACRVHEAIVALNYTPNEARKPASRRTAQDS